MDKPETGRATTPGSPARLPLLRGVMVKSNLIWTTLLSEDAQREHREWDAAHKATRRLGRPIKCRG